MRIDRVPHDGVSPIDKAELVSQCQSLVGRLNWLSVSARPDITTATSLLASYLHNPSQGHLDAGKYALKCLKGCADWGIRFTQPKANNQRDATGAGAWFQGVAAWPVADNEDGGAAAIPETDRLICSTDTGWGLQDASHPKEGELHQEHEVRSLLGTLTTFLGGPLDWGCHRESKTSRNVPFVSEAEVKAMDEGCKMILAIHNLFEDLGATMISNTTPLLFSDNQGGVKWASSEAITKKMRHINIREVDARDAERTQQVVLDHAHPRSTQPC